MKKGTIRAIVLSVVFILALIVSGYFTSSKDADLTADMGTATLPTVSFTTSKQEVNLLAGHLREMDISAVRNTIIPLDEKGEIQVNIQKYGQKITKFHYEILTADGTEKLAEKESFQHHYICCCDRWLPGHAATVQRRHVIPVCQRLPDPHLRVHHPGRFLEPGCGYFR